MTTLKLLGKAVHTIRGILEIHNHKLEEHTELLINLHKRLKDIEDLSENNKITKDG